MTGLSAVLLQLQRNAGVSGGATGAMSNLWCACLWCEHVTTYEQASVWSRLSTIPSRMAWKTSASWRPEQSSIERRSTLCKVSGTGPAVVQVVHASMRIGSWRRGYALSMEHMVTATNTVQDEE